MMAVPLASYARTPFTKMKWATATSAGKPASCRYYLFLETFQLIQDFTSSPTSPLCLFKTFYLQYQNKEIAQLAVETVSEYYAPEIKR